MLNSRHLNELKESGLTQETIDKYGFSSIDQAEAIQRGVSGAPSGGWILQYPNSSFFKFKPDKPDGRGKYINPKGVPVDIFITKQAEECEVNNSQPYFFVEGEKKALAVEQLGYAVIGLSGVWGFRSGGRTLDKLAKLNLKGRLAYIIYDSDKANKKYGQKEPPVIMAERELAITLCSLGSQVRIINLEEALGKGIDDQIVRFRKDGNPEALMPRLLDGAIEFSDESTLDRQLPLSLTDFLKQDYPPLEYYTEGILQKEGRTIISASTNTGKSFFLQNLALAIATGHDKFLGRFCIKGGRVLYLDYEMGKSALQERFRKMCTSSVADNLFVKYISSFNLLDKKDQNMLEIWLSELKADVLIIDPVGDAWQGDENDKKEVASVTSYLNALKDRFSTSILISHHWRKLNKDNKRGGEMASGSYKWGAWSDHHITLEGDKGNLALACGKSRNSAKFESFRIRLNVETLWFEYLGDYEKKFDDSTLIMLFDSFSLDRVAVPELIKKAEADKICSESTLRGIISDSKIFLVDKSGKTHYLVKKANQGELLDGTS